MSKDLIKQILNLELEMFSTVPSAQRATCQDDPEGFRVFRSAQFSPWSEETLQSYLNDLQEAKQKNENLMTLKYARMDNLIPKLHQSSSINQLIDEIVDIQMTWQNEMKERYPAIMTHGRSLDNQENSGGGTSFETYLRCELETYSAVTLASHFKDIVGRRDNKKNMTEEIYERMIKGLNYNSLKEAEEFISKAG